MRAPVLRVRLGRPARKLLDWLGCDELEVDLDLRELRDLVRLPVIGKPLLPERLRVLVRA